jgi:hypothetical protein
MTYYVVMPLETDIIVVQVGAKDWPDAIEQVIRAIGKWEPFAVFEEPPLNKPYWTINELEDYYD